MATFFNIFWKFSKNLKTLSLDIVFVIPKDWLNQTLENNNKTWNFKKEYSKSLCNYFSDMLQDSSIATQTSVAGSTQTKHFVSSSPLFSSSVLTARPQSLSISFDIKESFFHISSCSFSFDLNGIFCLPPQLRELHLLHCTKAFCNLQKWLFQIQCRECFVFCQRN